MAVQPIPEGYHSVTPYLVIDGAADAIRWYGEVLGATEVIRMEMGGKIGHAEIRIGDSMVMLADEHPGYSGPKSLGGSASSLMLYIEDVDRVFARAIAAGAMQDQPLEDKFYGDRSGSIVDPFGHRWTLATHVEDVSEEEMGRRMAEFTGGGGGSA